MAGTTKSIRIQIEEALVAGFQWVLSDAEWGFGASNVGAEPSELPMPQANYIGFRALTSNTHTTGTVDVYDPEAPIRDVESVIRLQAYGPYAMEWLNVFNHALGDVETLEYFRTLGFTVDPDDAGVTDVSEVFGSEEQMRGVAQITVGCRAIRDRVITLVDTVSVTLTVQDPDGVDSDIVSTFTADVSEP